MSDKEIKDEYTEDCGCRKCDTYADITEYECGCVEVRIYNDRDPCDECTDFSGKRYNCSEHY